MKPEGAHHVTVRMLQDRMVHTRWYEVMEGGSVKAPARGRRSPRKGKVLVALVHHA